MPVENRSGSPNQGNSIEPYGRIGRRAFKRIEDFLQAPPDPGRRAAIGLGLLAPPAVALALHPEGRAISDNLGLLETYSMLGRLAIIPETLSFSRDKKDPGAIILSGITRRTDLLGVKNGHVRATQVNIKMHDLDAAKSIMTLIRQAPGIIDTWNRVWQVGLVGATIAGSQSSGSDTVNSSSNGEFNPKNVPTYPPLKGPMGSLPKLGILGGALALVGACAYQAKRYFDNATKTPEGKATATALATLEATATDRLPTATPRPPIVVPTTGPDGTPTPSVEVTVEPLPIPPEPFPAVAITKQYLIDNGNTLKDNNSNTLPQPTPIPVPEGNNGSADITPVDYTKSAFEVKLTARQEFDFTDPVNILKYLVAQGAREGVNGGVTYFAPGVIPGETPAFAELSIYREQLNIPQGEYTITEGYPRGLVLRNGAGISVVGRDSQGNFVIAFEEYFLRGEKELKAPRMRLAVLTQNEFANISTKYLTNLQYFFEQPDQIIFTDKSVGVDRIAILNTIDEDVMNLIYDDNSAGAVWKDTYKGVDGSGNLADVLHPNPNIPFPKLEDLPEGVDRLKLDYVIKENDKRLGHIRAVTVHAMDRTNNQLMLIAEYFPNWGEWRWSRPTWRNVSNINNLPVGTSVVGTQKYDDDNFQRSIADHFAEVFPGVFFQTTLDQHGTGTADLMKQLVRQNYLSLHSHPGFYHLDIPDEMKSAPDEKVKDYMRKRAKFLLRYAGKVDEDAEPTKIQILNEALFYDYDAQNPARYVSWDEDNISGNNPFYRVFGDKLISQTYLIFYEEAVKMGLQIGKDVRFLVSEYDLHKPGGKTEFVYRELKRAKGEIATELGINSDDAQLDIAMQLRLFLDDSKRPYFYHNILRSPPTDDELLQAITRLSEIGRVHITEMIILDAENQEEVNEWYRRIFSLAVLSGKVDSINLWHPMNQTPPDGNPFSPQGLFDSRFRTTNNYKYLTGVLLELAEQNQLIG